MFKTLTILVASNILFDFIIQAIIVERNLHSYYRLPTTTVRTSNASEEYYILQCPLKASMNIPKPQDMPVCLIVGRHSENEEKQKELIKAKPRAVLNTQVDYRFLKPPPNLVKLVKMKNGKPYTMFLKPVNKKETSYKTPKTFIKQPYDTSSIKFFLTNPKTSFNQTTLLYSVPLIHKPLINDSLPLSTTKESQRFIPGTSPPTTIPTASLEDLSDEQDTQLGPLKYLGVQDNLRKLQKIQKPSPHPFNTNHTEYKSEKFFSDLDNYKKGFHSKGFQNMYHRDEIYQDHIFYDDLQQTGNYRIKDKLQPKQP